jgi:hypothetical protein
MLRDSLDKLEYEHGGARGEEGSSEIQMMILQIHAISSNST